MALVFSSVSCAFHGASIICSTLCPLANAVGSPEFTISFQQVLGACHLLPITAQLLVITMPTRKMHIYTKEATS